ncbi:carboxypeptidase regulatory-like domain-containing protein [Nonlabens agnitus]|uniref:Fibronectin type-III domain-containing protein n=1 Tax=Nonlabens agnitus TaxID=870484 RepID=A0A2S9WRV7_9FLAO|nr:carboxypeptidase regulatory-like domain-containing protein [Nonlabens agnitus]PRP66179.1 hypothetical protein BST86_03270 [Nonlabens agnitus]
MRKLQYLIIAVLAILVAGCTEETLSIDGGRGTITGTVVQDITFEPLVNVKISTNPNSNTVFTDASGKFSIEAEQGTYAVKAEKEGFLVEFESAEVATDEDTQVVFELQLSTANNRPPVAPDLIFPEDNATNINSEVTFNWDATDPDEDALTYTLEIRNATTDAVQRFTDLETSEQEVTLEFGTSYFWQVTVNDGVNESVNSTVNSFTTAPFPANRFHYVRKVSGNNIIYSADADGNEIQLTASSNNSYRPRTNRVVSKIAFLRSVGANTHVFVMDQDGRNKRQVTNTVPVAGFNMDEVDISWNNNGSVIYYPSLDKLYRINADGSGLSLVFQLSNGNLITEVDYNDGVIALKTNNFSGYNVEIFTISEAGQVLNTVLSGVKGAAGGLELSIDNSKLLYTYDVSEFESSNYRQINSRVFVHTFSTSTATDESDDKIAGTNDLDARFSPTDAQIIVNNRSNDSNSGGTIQVIDINSNIVNPRNDLFNNAFMPDWE